MQSISPLTSADFKDKSNIVIGKVEIDSDGAETYLGLTDVIDFSINTNIENRVGRLSSYSFSVTVLNTDDQYHPYNTSSSYYNYLRQGRRIKLYAGLKVGETEKHFQWLIGRVDDYRLNEQAGRNVCTITGRDFMRMITEYELYFPNTYWGTYETLNTVSGQIRYDLNANCKSVFKAELDYTNKDGTALEEIFENQDWGYDWHLNQFCFTEQRIPDFAGTNNLKVYYMTTQTVENVVGHILYVAGIFTTTGERDDWINNVVGDYVTPTDKTIDRVWFNTGTSALEAIRLLSEVVQYRLYFDYAGNPIFKPKASIGSSVDTILKSDTTVENIEENEEETYTHIIVTGEERDRVLGDDEIAPETPTGLDLTTGFGESTQAGLAWIKATWDANTEIDFGHYELRIKRNVDSDFLEVSTVATSYMFYGLEPGVTYNVIIRACDVYENRSAWSSTENIVTATDAGTPAQVAGETGTAIVAGIKIEWTKGSEDNIAYYLIERQESPDNVDWSGAWAEIARIDGDKWFDLFLTYSKWYRYKITAYTQAGVKGVTSNFTTAVQPAQVGEDDIAANAVTASKIYVIDLAAINADIGHITSGDLTLDSDGYVKTRYKDSYTDTTPGFWLGYEAGAYKLNIGSSAQYLKWNGSTLSIKGSITLINTIPNAKVDGLGDLALEDAADWQTQVDGAHKPDNDADVTLSAINGELSITGGGIVLSSGSPKIRAGQTSYGVGTGFWLGLVSGTPKFSIGSSTHYLKWTGSYLDIKGKISVGGLGTNDEIYFKDSSIYVYDAESGNYKRIFFRYGSLDFVRFSYYTSDNSTSLHLYTTNRDFSLVQAYGYAGVYTGATYLWLVAGAGEFCIRNTKTLRFPRPAAAPSSPYYGELAFKVASPYQFLFYSPVGWEYFYDGSGW